MDRRLGAARAVSAKLLAGDWEPAVLAAGIDQILGPGGKRARKRLIGGLIELGRTPYPPSPDRLTRYLVASRSFRPPLEIIPAFVLDSPLFAPAEPFAALDIPRLATLGELAQWLDLSIEDLDWLADERRSQGTSLDARLQHYRYAFAAKALGPPRLIEAPKTRLKSIQRRILDEILAKVPVHGAAHGFVAGRSCLGNAQIHAGEDVVIRFDLANFFPTLRLARIHGIFRCLGYPWAIARRLTGLCSTAAPASVFLALPEVERHDRSIQALYLARHLPQGAPTSPGLANLAAWQLDRRLDGLARRAGATYTRYADDLAFSGDAGFAAGLGRFQVQVETIVAEEGFRLNPAKTRIMRRNARQLITGIVVNEHCNIPRAEFDRLKAILHNCVRSGPDAQNRAEIGDFRRHLDGRIAWVEQINPRRGAALRAAFERIAWT